MSEPTDRDLIFAEISALRFLVGVLITAYPDKEQLLKIFDIMAAQVQIANVASGGGPLPLLSREAINSYRSQIAQFVQPQNEDRE